MGEPAKPGNTTGKVVGETASSDVPAASANPSLTAPDSVGTVKEQALKNIDDWVESTGYSTGAMVFGSVWKAVVEVAMPGSVGELAATVIPVGKIVKGVEVGAKAIGGALKAEKVIVTAAKSANEVEKVAEEAAKLEKKAAAVKKAQKESGQVKGKKNSGAEICKALAGEIWTKATVLSGRIADLLADKFNLSKLARSVPHPSLPKGSGSWDGHVYQADCQQRGLQNSLNEYDAAKCKEPRIPPHIRNLAYEPLPS